METEIVEIAGMWFKITQMNYTRFELLNLAEWFDHVGKYLYKPQRNF